MIDLEQLLAEASESPPCGPDLEYDAAFLELEQAALGKPEQQYGDTVVPAEEPAWADVRKRAPALLARSKDLRVATLLARALVCTEGFAGLKPGFDLIHGLLERYWDQLHPQLDPDDDNDPVMRMNALAALADPDGLLKDLRNAPLLRSRQGQVMVRDVEIALDKLPAKDGAEIVSLAQISGMMATAEGVAAGALVTETQASVKRLSSWLAEKVGSDQAPDFRPLMGTIATLLQVCAEPGEAAAQGGEPAADGAPPAAGGAPARGPSGEIRNRRDAMLMIDKVVDYFARNEPSNPAPLLLLRAKRLIDMSFVDIIKDMVPDGLPQIETIAGIKSEEDSY